jgi:hypothetical protein
MSNAPYYIWINKEFGLLNLSKVRAIRPVIIEDKNLFLITLEEYAEVGIKKPISIGFPNLETLQDYYNGICNTLNIIGAPDINGNNQSSAETSSDNLEGGNRKSENS